MSSSAETVTLLEMLLLQDLRFFFMNEVKRQREMHVNRPARSIEKLPQL